MGCLQTKLAGASQAEPSKGQNPPGFGCPPAAAAAQSPTNGAGAAAAAAAVTTARRPDAAAISPPPQRQSSEPLVPPTRRAPSIDLARGKQPAPARRALSIDLAHARAAAAGDPPSRPASPRSRPTSPRSKPSSPKASAVASSPTKGGQRMVTFAAQRVLSSTDTSNNNSSSSSSAASSPRAGRSPDAGTRGSPTRRPGGVGGGGASAAAATAAAAAAAAASASAAAGSEHVQLLRASRSLRVLKERRGGINASFKQMQDQLATTVPPRVHVKTRAAGLKHIGFGPFKRENQDEFYIQIGDVGGGPGSNLFCVFDGHGTAGKDAAANSRQVLPALLDAEMRKYLARVKSPQEGIQGAVEVLLNEVFGETERTLAKAGIPLSHSGTTASVAYQRGNQLWVASVGDSRVILCSRTAPGGWRVLPLTIDHRPRRQSERERVEAAGGRVAPKRLASGRSVGEPRLWLQDIPSPGLLLSRSLGDLMAATVGCTSDPEVTYATLRPDTDFFLVLASDGVWDVLTNEQVCDMVVESPDPHTACRRVLDAALYEWEERMSADNISVLVVEFDWTPAGPAPPPPPAAAAGAAAAGGSPRGGSSAAPSAELEDVQLSVADVAGP